MKMDTLITCTIRRMFCYQNMNPVPSSEGLSFNYSINFISDNKSIQFIMATKSNVNRRTVTYSFRSTSELISGLVITRTRAFYF